MVWDLMGEDSEGGWMYMCVLSLVVAVDVPYLASSNRGY